MKMEKMKLGVKKMKEGKNECEKCGSTEFRTELMFLVSGQVDGPESEIEVSVCMHGGHKVAIS